MGGWGSRERETRREVAANRIIIISVFLLPFNTKPFISVQEKN